MKRIMIDGLIDGIVIAAMLTCIVLIAGCLGADRPVSPQPDGGAGGTPSAAASLAHLGATCTWIGGLALVGGIVVRVAAVVVPVIAFAAPLAGIAAACGSVCLVCGLAFQWLAGNLWLLALVVILGGAAAVWLHWRHLRPDLGRLAAQGAAIVRRPQRLKHEG